MDIVARAKGIVLDPKREWERVATERDGVAAVYLGYAIPLALIPAIAGFLGATLIGLPVPGVGSIRLGFGEALATGAVQFALGLGLVYLIAMIVHRIAPSFEGGGDMAAAFRTTAYAWTPAWLSGVFAILPALGFLSLLGLYSVYLLYLGLPRTMGVTQDKALPYTLVVVLISLMLLFALSSLFVLVGVG